MIWLKKAVGVPVVEMEVPSCIKSSKTDATHRVRAGCPARSLPQDRWAVSPTTIEIDDASEAASGSDETAYMQD
jgi:hypothetical protein